MSDGDKWGGKDKAGQRVRWGKVGSGSFKWSGQAGNI